MDNNNSIEIKKLIKKGYDLELISFEFDISLELLKKYKNELDKSCSKKKEEDIYTEIKNKITYIRKKYIELFENNSSDTKNSIQVKTLKQDEIDLINDTLDFIKKIIDDMPNISKVKKRENAIEMLKQMKKIEKLPLTLQQADLLLSLINSEELKNIKRDKEDNIEKIIYNKKVLAIRKLAEAIDFEYLKVESVEELKQLQRKLDFNDFNSIQFLSIESVKSKIRRKIDKIQQKEAIEKIKNDIPEFLENIIKDLINDTLDIKQAKQIITEEAKKKTQQKSRTIFSLTEEQEISKFLMQIRTALVENPKKYKIEKTKSTLNNLQKLCPDNFEQSVRAVVINLVKNKQFEKAKNICNAMTRDDNKAFIINLQLEIKNAEIADTTLKILSKEDISVKEMEYIRFIEEEIKMKRINLSEISLGKNKEGTKKITLADIWFNEKVKER